MEPRNPTEEEVNYWAAREGSWAITESFTAPEEIREGILPCPAVFLPDKKLIAVCWELSEIELIQLAKGGKLWLACYGGLPVHSVEVVTQEELHGPTGISPF